MNFFINNFFNHFLFLISFGLPLPYTATEGGPRYILIRPQVWNPQKYSMQDVFKVSTMINDIQLRCDDNWVVAGQVGILDLTGITREHLMQLNPDLVNKMIMLSQDTYPIRQQAVIIELVCEFINNNHVLGF